MSFPPPLWVLPEFTYDIDAGTPGTHHSSHTSSSPYFTPERRFMDEFFEFDFEVVSANTVVSLAAPPSCVAMTNTSRSLSS
mmetsp:Transcript_14718/g.23791  ORF Transcript_14718/g.23791 Transcript_14718/m.23791 type:complete len:81 (+) Transcript_14718:270-512(+)